MADQPQQTYGFKYIFVKASCAVCQHYTGPHCGKHCNAPILNPVESICNDYTNPYYSRYWYVNVWWHCAGKARNFINKVLRRGEQ